jgi:CheY-like chemotaxis protein
MQGASKRVFVVDQSRTIQILLRQYLGNVGHQVLTCSTPQEALKAFTGLRQAPDVVFLAIDDREPYKLITYLKEHYHHTRIVAMVLAEEKAAIQRTLGASQVDYLIKPFQIQGALALVSALAPGGASSEHIYG